MEMSKSAGAHTRTHHVKKSSIIVLLSIALAIVLAASLLPIFSRMAMGEDGDGGSSTSGPVRANGDPDDTTPGALVLHKDSTPSDKTDQDNNIWEWDITVSLSGLDLIATSDIVLLIDTSNSMNTNSKITNAITAAVTFVGELLGSTNDGGTRIAVVSFSDNAVVRSGFTTNVTNLTNVIKALSAGGNTNIQAGIIAAQGLLDASTASNKYIVMLGDGEPTLSYRINGAEGVTYNNGWVYDINDPGFSLSFVSPYATTGGGSYSGGITGINIGGRTFPPNNGIPSIYQARLAKEAGIEIYSIAVLASTELTGIEVLSAIASDSDHYYLVTNSAGLGAVYNEIAGKIAFAAENANVTDPIGEHFVIVDADGNPVTPANFGSNVVIKDNTGAVAGTAEMIVNSDTGQQTIKWHIDRIEQDKSPYTMTYTLKIDSTSGDTSSDVMYPTNGTTIVEYVDSTGQSTSKEFLPIPTVGFPQVGSVTVYYYLLDSQGRPLNAQGLPAASIDDVEFYTTETLSRGDLGIASGDPLSTAIPYGSYTYEAESLLTIGADKYVFVGNNGNNAIHFSDRSPTFITVNVQNQSAKVYYAYSQVLYDRIVVDFTKAAGGGFSRYYGNPDALLSEIESFLQAEVDNQLGAQGLANGDIIVSVTGRVAGEDVLGSPYAYTVSWENKVGATYQFSTSEVYIAADLTIVPRPITITVNNSSKAYGTADPNFTGGITLNTLVTPGDLGTITYSRTNTAVNTPGVYTGVLTASYTANPNYTVTVVNGNFTIRANTITVRLTSLASAGYTKVYGEADPALASVQADIQAQVDAQLVAQELNAGDIVVTVTGRTAGENIGTYAYEITWDNAVGAPYQFYANEVTLVADLTITPRPITITVDYSYKNFGNLDPVFTGSITSGTLMAAGDLGTITYVRTNATVETPGFYAGVLTANYTANSNYTVTVVPGDFKIWAETIEVDFTAAAATGYTKVYGDADPTLATVQADLQAAVNLQLAAQGLSAGDIIVTVTGRAAGENVVGSPYAYTITWANAPDAPYQFSANEVILAADLTITPRPVTITVDDAAKDFGDLDPAFTGSITSGSLVLAGDLGTITYSRTNASIETPGVYAGVLEATYTANANYSVTVVAGDFTIRAETITVDLTAAATAGYTKVYGEADPTLASVAADLQAAVNLQLVAQGLNAGDIVVSVSGRAAGENVVGSPYAYNITWVNAAGSTYTFTNSEVALAADLTITPRPVTITVDNSSKDFATPDPAFTGSITSGSLVAAGDLGTIIYERTNPFTETPGFYAGVLEAVYTANSNYAVTVVAGDFTIRAETITVDYTAAAAAGYTKVYGNADPALATVQANIQAAVNAQLVIQGLNAGEIIVTVSGRAAGENVVGSPYAYNITWANASGSTYTFITSEVVLAADLSITRRPVTITVANASKDYGTADPAFSGSITSGSLVAAGDLGVITYSRTNATVNTPGTYAGVLTASYTANSNYTVTVVPGTFTIRASTITVNLTAAASAGYTKVFGTADPALATIQSALQAAVNTQLVAQGLSAGNIVVSVTGRAAGENVVGSPYAYNITWSNAAGSSYTFVASEVALAADLAITQRPVTITVANATKVAGNADPAFTGSITSGSLVTAGDLGTITYYRTNATVNVAGTYTGVITANYTANTNYIVTVVPGTFTITTPITPPPPPPVTGATYTVIHTNADNGTVLLTETLIGTVGATVTAIPQSFDGYVYAPADGRQVISGVVLADGSLVLRLYYIATPNHVPVIPPTPIPPETVPLAAPTAAWALVNLILSIVGILLALGLFIAYFSRNTKEEEHDRRRDKRRGHEGYDERTEAREEARSKRMVWRIVTLVAGILAIILFFLTEDMTLPMGLVDYWTIAHVIIFILQIVFMVLATKRKREEEDVHDRPKYAGSPAL